MGGSGHRDLPGGDFFRSARLKIIAEASPAVIEIGSLDNRGNLLTPNPIAQIQREQKLENEMKTGVYVGVYNIVPLK